MREEMTKIFGLFPIVVCLLTDTMTLNRANAENIGTATYICEKFLQDKNLISLITTQKAARTPCACAEYDMQQDAIFEKVGHCYEEWLYNDGVKQRCCYSTTGLLLPGYRDGGFVILDGIEHSINAIHDGCCNNNNKLLCKTFYNITQSYNCKRYTDQLSAYSWGDPVIETVSNTSYSFNGHGEYVFLKSNNTFEIQARTDYLTPTSNDSTLFTAFVFTNYEQSQRESIHVIFNRTSLNLNLYDNNGSLKTSTPPICTPGRPPIITKAFTVICLKPPSPLGFQIIPQVKLANVKAFITLDNGFMNIKIVSTQKLANMTGLAGNVHGGFYVVPNGTKYSVNSSESLMFEYGETWSLRNNPTSSNFWYNLTGEDFNFYNTKSTPRFLENLLDQPNELFKECNTSMIPAFENTCRNSWDNQTNKECMLTIARTCNTTLGKAIQDQVERQRYELQRKSNKPPTFMASMSNETTLIYKGNSSWIYNLLDYVQDENRAGLRFEVAPNITEMEIVGGVFNWTVGAALRYMNLSDNSIRFIVYDQFNMSDSHSVRIRYCGCEDPSECEFQNEDDDNAECKCRNRFVEGLFCEMNIDPCSKYVCYKNETCNKTYSGNGSPCAVCPPGFYEEIIGPNQFCRDLNECNDTRTHNCEQECNNDVGFYHCACNNGYQLKGNFACSDVDECVLGNYSCPNPHEACVNLPGTYTCGCQSGYSKFNKTSLCVKIESKMYFGYFEYIIQTNNIPQTNDTLQNAIATTSTEFTNFLNTSTNFSSIEIYRIYKRKDVVGILVHFDFILHMTSTRDRQDIVKDLAGKLNQIQGIALSSFPQMTLNPPLKVFHLHPPDKGGICDVVPKRSDCLEQSTHCVNKEIDMDYYDCECNAGFKKPITGNKRDVYCDDVNECELFERNNTTGERCVHGLLCSNTYGSWNCTCPTDRLWMSVGSTEDPIYRCQGNHSYLGNITFIWDVRKEKLTQSTIVSFLKDEIIKTFMDPSLDAERKTAVPITSLLVSVTVLSNTSFIPPSFGDLYMMTYEFRIRMGDPVSTKRLQKIAHDCFRNDTYVGPASFQNMTIFNESDNELCKRANNGRCDMRTTVCVQANGTTNCECKPGYNMHPDDSHACQDVNECNSGHLCIGGTCENTEGNWTCICPLETSRVVLNETVQNCSAAAFNMCTSMETPYRLFTCRNGERICENSTLSCRCLPGYFVNGNGINSTCEDVDECSNNPCENGMCVNTNGSHHCICNKGYMFDDTEKTCIDIDECLHPDDMCVNGHCTNNNGSYTCICLNGFYEQFRNQYVTYCTDINECTNASYSCDGICTNLQGSFTCACPPGYRASGDDDMHFMCKDFDECANPGGYQCINGTCNNTNGSWNCVCGFSSRPVQMNNSLIECIEIYRYPMQFEVQEISLPGGGQLSDKEIQDLLIKKLTDILNTSQTLGGKVQYPVELLPDGYYHPTNGNISINVTVILSTMSNDSALKTVFEKSNSSQRTIVAGNILVISLSKTEVYVDQCKLHSKDCDFNSAICVFDKAKGIVSCNCRTGYKDVKYVKGVGICEPVKESKEEFAYFATVSITIEVNTNSDNSSLKETVKQQITYIYRTMFPNDKIWVEIVRLFSGNARRKRSTTQQEVEFIVHTNESKNETDITQAWENCTHVNSSCYSAENAYLNTTFGIIFNSTVNIDETKDLCTISKACDTNTTTCTNNSKTVACSCKPGYVNNTFINETSCYTCKRPADFPEITSTTVGSEITTTIMPSSYLKSTSRPDYDVTNTPSSAEQTHLPTIYPVKTGTTSSVDTNKPKATTEANERNVSPKADTTTKAKDGVDVKQYDKPDSSSNTALIATGASLGSVVLILIITIIVVCRLRSKKARDTETIKLRELEKDHRNGFDNSLLGRNYLRSDSKQNSTNYLRQSDRDKSRNSYNGGPFKPIQPNYTRPFRSGDPDSTWDLNGHVPGMNGRSGSLPDINNHVDMRLAREARRLSYQRDSDPLYSSPKKDKDPPPTQKPMDNYKQNMVRVFPESGERLPRARNSQFPRNTGNGRISPEPDYHGPPLSPKPDYHDKLSRDRLNASNDSGLNGFSRSSRSPDVQRSRESFGYGSLGRGRYRMEGTPF
ncbi:uncharacterized protein LOC127865825 isoform X2 [Dreissena polymorpha]|nr:uncharacterized protein LOC127865825 isoform X2 [Dreissena polymorpha]